MPCTADMCMSTAYMQPEVSHVLPMAMVKRRACKLALQEGDTLANGTLRRFSSKALDWVSTMTPMYNDCSMCEGPSNASFRLMRFTMPKTTESKWPCGGWDIDHLP